MTGYVFEEDPLGAAFPDDSGNVRPEVPGVVGTAALSSGTERLAGVTGKDDVEGTAEGPGIEAAQIVPDWGRGEVSGCLRRDEHRPWPVLPLDEGAGVIVGLGEHEAQIKASAACAEGQSVPGT